MGTQSPTLRETLLANFTLIRSFASMRPTMFNQILPRAERFPTELADLRFLSSVYPNMNLHVLPPDQFPADLASHLALPGMRPQVFLVTVTVKRLEPADLASVFFPALRLAVDLHVTPQVHAIPEGFMTNLAGAGFVVAVNAHVCLQGRLQIESLIADLAEFRKLFIVSSDVNFQIILRGQLGSTHVAYVRCSVQRFVNVQVLLLLEHLVTNIALDGSYILILSFDFDGLRSVPRFVRFFASNPSVLQQLYFPRERFATRFAGVLLLGLLQGFSRPKDRPFGSVNQQNSLCFELFVAGLASERCCTRDFFRWRFCDTRPGRYLHDFRSSFGIPVC